MYISLLSMLQQLILGSGAIGIGDVLNGDGDGVMGMEMIDEWINMWIAPQGMHVPCGVAVT